MEGLSWKEIEVDHPNALADWRADPHAFRPPGGESHAELRRRTKPHWPTSLLRTAAPSSSATA